MKLCFFFSILPFKNNENDENESQNKKKHLRKQKIKKCQHIFIVPLFVYILHMHFCLATKRF